MIPLDKRMAVYPSLFSAVTLLQGVVGGDTMSDYRKKLETAEGLHGAEIILPVSVNVE